MDIGSHGKKELKTSTWMNDSEVPEEGTSLEVNKLMGKGGGVKGDSSRQGSQYLF